VPDVLAMTARELGDPVARIICDKSPDLLQH
jgi:hypothetical protein